MFRGVWEILPWFQNVKFFSYIFSKIPKDVTFLFWLCIYLKLLCVYVCMCPCVPWCRNAVLATFCNLISWIIPFSPMTRSDTTFYIQFPYTYRFISGFFVLFYLVNLSWLPLLRNKSSFLGKNSAFYFSELSLLLILFHIHFIRFYMSQENC